MEDQQNKLDISVIWRGNKFTVKTYSSATLKELGRELQALTGVKADTMRLIAPQPSNKTSKLLSPFSDEHSCLNLQETFILEGKAIRMMGVSEEEVGEVLQNAKADLRIAGFDEEEKRLKQRTLNGPHTFLKLPQGNYIFCDFRTLQIPGIELNPPASEALKRMHMLAADPGIVAIMNKHRWRVGIMTEMAPEGYVGVSPKCILGFNKNHGEEISLRLRTDDLKGFRKYDSIKKTLLHELAHMVFSEHDANFHALDKQLNQEAASLDWTKSRGQTLSGAKHTDTDRYEEDFNVLSSSTTTQKLGGNSLIHLANARESSVAAAYFRLANSSTEVDEEPDPDAYDGFEAMECEPVSEIKVNVISSEPDPDASEVAVNYGVVSEPDPDASQTMEIGEEENPLTKTHFEPDPDASQTMEIGEREHPITKTHFEPDPDASEGLKIEAVKNGIQVTKAYKEPDPDASEENVISGRDDYVVGVSQKQIDEPDPDASQENKFDELDPDASELSRIQDPVTAVCNRLQKAIEMLRSEVNNPTEVTTVLQTLFKIIGNVIEHPDESKFRRLRKANVTFQRNIANYRAAMEVLSLVGFNDDVVSDEIGRVETYLVLKRNDPGLLWLAKSSLETCITY